MGNRFNRYCFFLLLCLASRFTVGAQSYHAIQGSSYAGSLGTGNNPSSIVNTPYPWDLAVLSAQLKYTTNSVTIYNYSLLNSATGSQYGFDNGNFSRYADFNFNANVLNGRIAINRRHAIAFGLNLRGYGSIKTGGYNYIDTIRKITHLLTLNQDDTKYEMDLVQSGWVELFATYSRTIWDREADRLNAGLTVKVMRGLSGAHGSMKNFTSTFLPSAIPPVYNIVTGNAEYGYSSNYDVWQKNKTANDNLNKFFKHSQGGLSLDFGVEYIVKSQAVTSFYDDEVYFDYEWKAGLSLLDIGQNNFRYGNNSRSFSTLNPNITDVILQKKFDSIHSVKAFNDSLASVVANSTNLPGNFSIINPARMVVNVDRYLFNQFYLNAELSINLSPLAGNRKFVKDLNLLTITPRWETRRWGGYLPIAYNTHGKLWVGGAFKAGPLLFGIHNWGNVFSKKKMANGGGYLALIIKPGIVTGTAKDKRFDCPPLK